MFNSETQTWDLTKVHTRELLDWLRRARACGGRYDPTECGGRFFVTIAQLKAELATREHVPNKQEGRALRQAKAKQRPERRAGRRRGRR